jgi:hypothetical protein
MAIPSLPDERDRHIAGLSSSPIEEDDDLPEFDGADVVEDEDGGATLTLPESEEPASSSFYDNLVPELKSTRDIALDLLEKIEKDKESRKKRDEIYADGIRRTGLGDDAPGGATFEGASKVVHPALAEGCVDFAASSSKEILPAAGPVKIAIKGKQDQKQLERAKAKAAYLNHLLTKGIPEYYPEKKTMLTQLPLGGSQYEKYWPEDGEYHMEFVPVDKVHLPFAAASFHTAGRFTHQLELTEDEFLARVDSGRYIDIDNLVTEAMPEQSSAEVASDKVEGKDPTIYNEDGLRTLYETTVYLRVKDDPETKGKRAPYVVTIDEATEQPVGFYRNWTEGDAKTKRLDWWVDDTFIPWRGAQGIGLPHLIGGMAGAITGSLRALLDSAHINNTAAMLKAKTGRSSGSNTTVDPVGVTEIDMGTIDDIRKIAMPMPYNPPSPILFSLMQFLIAEAKGVVATAEEKIADASNQMPVGTALALIEQGSKVFSSIHQGLHFSQASGIQIVCRMVHDYPNAEELQQWGLTVEDFAENTDIEPVSDPNIFSESQRYAQWQAVMQMAGDPSVQYNKTELHRRGLELLRWPDVDSILPPAPIPITADPVTENQQALLIGAQLKADPAQDHLAHLMEHVRILIDPMIGAGPLYQGQQLMPILQHCGQHMAFLYKNDVFKHSAQLGVQAAVQGIPPGTLTPDQIAAQAAAIAQKENMNGPLGPLFQQLGHAAQIVQGKMPPQPMDPVQSTFNAAKMETDRRAKADQDKAALDKARLDFEQQLAGKTMQQELQNQQQTLMAQMKKDNDLLQAKLKDIEQKQQTADDSFLIEIMKLNKENQQGQADAAAREAEMGQRLGAVETAVNAPPETPPDPTPHLDRLQQIVEQGKQAAPQQPDVHQQALMAAVQGIHGLLAQKRPNKIVRDPKTGDAIGMTYDQNLENPA